MAVRSLILPDNVGKLSQAAAQQYFETILDTCSFLREQVIDRIEGGIRSQSRYDDNSPPKEVKKEEFKMGDLELTLVTIPTEKKPQYSKTYERILEYVKFLEEDFEEGNLHGNLKDVEGKPYVSLDMLVKRIKGFRETSDGVRQEFHYEKPEAVPQKLVVPVVDYSTLPSEAEIYPGAKAFFDEAVLRGQRAFENLLGEHALKSAKKDVVEEDGAVRAWKSLGDYLFKTLVSAPSPSVSYASIYNALVKEDKKEERCGELILLQMGFEQNMPRIIVSAYDLRKDKMVSLNGFKKRLHRLYLENSSVKEAGKISVRGFPAV